MYILIKGCLSSPYWHHNVIRPDTIEVEYYNLEGQMIREKLNSMTSRVFQHEYDHLHGI